MLETASRFPFSPSAFQAPLQTSNFQVRNRTTGAIMSPSKRSDVRNHLHSPFLTKIHLCPPVSQPDATGYSVAELGTIEANPLGFADDFIAEHSSSGLAFAPTDPVTGSIRPQAPAASKSVRS
jgi:hypothetical protein